MLEFIGSLVQQGINLLLQIISASGYLGVFLLMVLESACMPIPSEVVMPFAGYLASTGQFNIWIVTLVSTLANLVGSVITYVVGLYLGREFILKYGKYILLKKKYLILAEEWFKKYGNKAIFFSRMLPVVRTVISLPAGIGRMEFSKFVLYTFVGSLPWNFAFAYLGYWFGKNWEAVVTASHEFNYIILGLAALVVVVLYLLGRRKKKKGEEKF